MTIQAFIDGLIADIQLNDSYSENLKSTYSGIKELLRSASELLEKSEKETVKSRIADFIASTEIFQFDTDDRENIVEVLGRFNHEWDLGIEIELARWMFGSEIVVVNNRATNSQHKKEQSFSCSTCAAPIEIRLLEGGNSISSWMIFKCNNCESLNFSLLPGGLQRFELHGATPVKTVAKDRYNQDEMVEYLGKLANAHNFLQVQFVAGDAPFEVSIITSELEEGVTDFFMDKKYGNGCSTVYLRILCIDKEIEGIVTSLNFCEYSASEKRIEIDIDVAYKIVESARSKGDVLRSVINSAINAVSEIDELGVPDFDVESFVQDFSNYLEQFMGSYPHKNEALNFDASKN